MDYIMGKVSIIIPFNHSGILKVNIYGIPKRKVS
jgi:hypothetical protein